MHVGEGERRSLAAEVDGLHRRTLLRRALAGSCAVGLGGATAAAGLPATAAATATATATAGGPGAESGPESGPGPDDRALAAFGESVELALVAAYERAIETGVLGRLIDAVALDFAAHHRAHAAALARVERGTAGGRATAALLRSLEPRLAASPTRDQVLEFVLDLEEAAVATHLAALGAFGSAEALRVAASILPVESQHATVWGIVLGRTGAALFPDGGQAFETDTAAFDSARYPPD